LDIHLKIIILNIRGILMFIKFSFSNCICLIIFSKLKFINILLIIKMKNFNDQNTKFHPQKSTNLVIKVNKLNTFSLIKNYFIHHIF
jgi:hypothetical protein